MSRVLLVDSDPEVIRTCRVVLEGAGHQLYTALDAPEAMRMVASRPPDIVFTTATVGHVSGVALCRALFTKPRHFILRGPVVSDAAYCRRLR